MGKPASLLIPSLPAEKDFPPSCYRPVGICLYDPAKAAYLYDSQRISTHTGQQYPTFLPVCGHEVSGDSLVGIRYREDGYGVFLVPAGDPPLHPLFHPACDGLLKADAQAALVYDANWQRGPWQGLGLE